MRDFYPVVKAVLKMLCNVLIIALVWSVTFGCSGSGPESDEHGGQWCYLESGWYLILKDWHQAQQKRFETQAEWPSVGKVHDVWQAYQTDPNMELSTLYAGNFTLSELHEYQDKGYPVVIHYWNETMYHVRPLWHHENPSVLIEWAYVAFPHQEKE